VIFADGVEDYLRSIIPAPDPVLAVGEAVMTSLPALDRKLAAVLSDPGSGFDQVIIQVDSRLYYDALMQVIDVCTRQKLPSGEQLTKLSFVELPVGG
jgi:hypothetical protein